MKPQRIQKTLCNGCGRTVPGYDIVNYGSVEAGYRALCGKCFNTEVARSDGLIGFEHAEIEPAEFTDCDGETPVFHFRTRLFGPGVALDAFEIRNGNPAGYRFQMIGEPEHDPLELLARLIGKIRRALAIKHVEVDGSRMRITDQMAVRGRLAWDEAQDGRVPLIVIDGREITWTELGRMLMTFEGWQLKLQIRDQSEEL